MSGWTVRFLFKFSSGKDTLINFISGIDKGVHRVLIQKRTEGEWGKTTIHQFVLSAGYKINQSVLAGNFYNLMQKTVNKDVVIIDACI